MGNPRAFLTIDRKEAGYRPVHERIDDFSEVEQTLNSSDRRKQASRCMECGVPFCHWACPLGNKQPEWQELLFKGRWREAYLVLEQTCDFPEFTGRICPALCEKSCVLKLSADAPVTIRENEAAIIEAAFREGYIQPVSPVRNGKKVAVIGSGPAGLAAANQLNRKGYQVTVFEKDELPGGLLRFGIPNFKLSKAIIDRRIRLMKEEGIEFRVNTMAGKDILAKDIVKEYDAVCVAIGSEVPRDLPIEGRNLKGIHFALELLGQQNRLLEGIQIPPKNIINAKGKKVLVIGGGDTGSDCVGTANRHGAASVTQIEILPQPPAGHNPATPWPMYPQVLKTSSSHEEGCTRRWNLASCRFIGEKNILKGVEVEEVEWITPADGGRQIMKPTGKKEIIEADLVFLAMGFVHPEQEGLVKELKLATNDRKNIQVNENGYTETENIFACGDAATGASLVVTAMAGGRKTAAAIDKYLKKSSHHSLRSLVVSAHYVR
ncbi:MAG: glutamate synthase subunit beta [Tannerellaceae bacterium]|nr:glutamate synthase subunit beta [Tannerellaceae bacterium]